MYSSGYHSVSHKITNGNSKVIEKRLYVHEAMITTILNTSPCIVFVPFLFGYFIHLITVQSTNKKSIFLMVNCNNVPIQVCLSSEHS